MTTSRIFKRTPMQYIKPTEAVKASASSAPSVILPKPSVNGAKHSGKPSQTHLQYGRTNFSESVTSRNGGAQVIDISDKAKAVLALSSELKELEVLQLSVGEKMSVLLFEQMRLAEKCRIINRSMEALLK